MTRSPIFSPPPRPRHRRKPPVRHNAFAAQWLAYTLPYRRFAVILAEDCARIGGDVGCYSFIAVDSHHILLAGLPAHIAVGTAIAGRAPPRSGLAQLRHPAPTLGV